MACIVMTCIVMAHIEIEVLLDAAPPEQCKRFRNVFRRVCRHVFRHVFRRVSRHVSRHVFRHVRHWNSSMWPEALPDASAYAI